MRLLGVVLVWAAIACAVGVFLVGRDRPARTAALQPEAMESQPATSDGYGDGAEMTQGMAGYTLEITPTFTPAPDPFAFQDDPLSRAGLVVLKNGRILYTYDRTEPAVPTIELSPAPGLEPGLVEYLVEAAPPLEETKAPQRRAVRVRLLHHGAIVAEKTLWSEPGGVVRGVLRAEIDASDDAEGEAAHGG